ncbi:hypothetical protein, partial [Pseudomonas sp. HMSC067G02]
METPTTPRSTLNPPVFYTSAALILALVLFTVLLQEGYTDLMVDGAP